MSMRSFFSGTAMLALLALLAGCADMPPPRSTGSQRQAAIDSLTHDVPPTSLEMASGQCWMQQEKSKNVNNLDAKIAAVDECIAEKKRQYPGLVN